MRATGQTAVLVLFSFSLLSCKTGDSPASPRGTNLLPPKETKVTENAKPEDVIPKGAGDAAGTSTRSTPAPDVELEGSGVNNGIGGAIVTLFNCKSDEGRFTLRTTAILTAFQGVLEIGEDSAVYFCRPESEAEKPRELFIWNCFDFEKEDERPLLSIRKDLHTGKPYAEIWREEGEKTMECSEPKKREKK